jgi:glycosyltransferase involved in cell wall biosynthesis
MTHEPRVSVILTVRNGERHIHAAIESMVAQTLEAWELIVIDDGSSDQTAAIIETFANSDARIQLVRTLGVGRAAALNMALERAQAPYVANIDVDDPSHPQRLDMLVKAMESASLYAVIGTRSLYLIEDEQPRWQSYSALEAEIRDITKALVRYNPINHSSVIMRTDALRNVNGYRTLRSSLDYDLWTRLAQAGYRLGMLSAMLASKRLHHAQHFERSSRIPYLWDSVNVQARAVAAFGNWYHWALLPARFAYGLLPGRLRRTVRSRRGSILVANEEH